MCAATCVLCSDRQHGVIACLALAGEYGLASFEHKCRTFCLEQLDWAAHCCQAGRATLTKQLGEQLAAPQLAELLMDVVEARRQELNELAKLAISLLEEFETQMKFSALADHSVEDCLSIVRDNLFNREDCDWENEEFYLTADHSYPLPFGP